MIRETLHLRSRIVQRVRDFFLGIGYLEVDVPLLTPAPIPEHTIELFRTEYMDRYDRSHELFLTPSPEIYLKRLLSQGVGNLFCVSRAFRNVEQRGPQHNPEFTMLEYYTVDGDYRDSMRLTERLLAFIIGGVGDELRAYRRSRGRTEAPPWWESLGSSEKPARIPGARVRELFDQYAGLDLDSLIADQKGVDKPIDFEVIFHKALLEKIEPHIPQDGPFVLWDYPNELRTLAAESNDPRYAQRWELYIEGMEVANCFTEETDPVAVEAYFRDEEECLGETRVPRP